MADLRPGSWPWRGAVAEAMLGLAFARLAVASVGFARWRNWLGPPSDNARSAPQPGAETVALARAVERAASHLPFATKCLPRGIALHWLLRRRGLPSRLVIAVLPAAARGSAETLHAWVETGGAILIGALDEPYRPVASFGD